MPLTKRDYYEILGIAKTAAVEEIKRAYRALALKIHPDRVPAEQKKEAEEKFKELSEAYAVLSDPQKRAAYDQYGHAGFDQRYSTEDIFRNADFSSIFGEMGGSGSIFEDVLAGMFGGGTGRRGTRGADLEYELPLSFEEAARGMRRHITIQRRELCAECKGEGGTRATCPACQGRGQVRQSAGFMVIARTCGQCGGQGSVVKKACQTCRGSGRVSMDRKLEVTVPAGVESGMRLRLTGEGEGGTHGRGDLYVRLRVAPHPLFERHGADLLLEYPITVVQAALGAELELPTLNGRVSMKVPAGTQSGTTLRVRGKGLPDVRHGRPGDLLVHVTVETPAKLTAAQRRQLEEFGRALGPETHPAQKTFLERMKALLRS